MQLVASYQAGVTDYTGSAEVDPSRTMMPAGQGIGAIREILPVREIIQRMMGEAEETIARLNDLAR
jgi:NAD(P)H-dependent flavin oxidoreductase YrpB (nitropropane dioxygenase family)